MTETSVCVKVECGCGTEPVCLVVVGAKAVGGENILLRLASAWNDPNVNGFGAVANWMGLGWLCAAK